jgi:hypothetical protein
MKPELNRSVRSPGVSRLRQSLLLALFIIFFSAAARVSAHCDALDGPVVADAKAAITENDVSPVLKWVRKEAEAEIREAFAATMKVRALSDDARKVADTHFFETLVRLHRAGEGEPFTGLKPAGKIDPGFLAADQALHTGELAALETQLLASVKEQLRKRFANVLEKRRHVDHSLLAGRAYVAAYVEYAHFVEALHTLTAGKGPENHQLHPAHAHGE